MSFFAPDAVLELSDLGLGTFEGADAIRAFSEDWYRAYEEDGVEAEEIVDLGNGVVFTVNRQVGRLIGSSESAQLHDAYVFLYEDSLILRYAAYRDIDEARAGAERLAEPRR